MIEKNLYNMSPHVIHWNFWSRQNYWRIKRASFSKEHNQVTAELANGLIYLLPVSYCTLHQTCMQPYVSNTTNTSLSEWAVRVLVRQERRGDPYDIIRIYNRRMYGYWIISAYTLLTVIEAAYEDFCHKRYSDFRPEPVIDFIFNNRNTTAIKIRPKFLKDREFFCVDHIYLYKRLKSIHFFTRSGDRYAVSLSNKTDIYDIVNIIGGDKFTVFHKNDSRHMQTFGGGGSYLSTSCLERSVRNAINEFVMRFAFMVDYRFKNNYDNYIHNKTWYIYPVEVIIKDDFKWQSQYSW